MPLKRNVMVRDIGTSAPRSAQTIRPSGIISRSIQDYVVKIVMTHAPCPMWKLNATSIGTRTLKRSPVRTWKKPANTTYYETGKSENRDFVCPPGVKELKCYVQRYANLQRAFKTNYDTPGTSSTLYKAGAHWLKNGKAENRDFSCSDGTQTTRPGELSREP